MTHIPDEAVQAAVKAYSKQMDYNDSHVDAVKTALTSAIPYLSAPCDVEVRQLEFVEVSYGFIAHTAFGTYKISVKWGEYEKVAMVIAGGELPKSFHDETEAAKAAAQADFERRILSCVVTKPVDVPALLQEVSSGERDGFINTGKEPHGNDADLSCPCCGGSGHKDDAKPVDVAAGLEQAAKFLDQRVHAYVQEHGMTDPSTGVVEFPGWGDEYVSELEDLAEAIRALSAEPA